MGLSNLVATFPGLDPMVARKIADHDIDGEAFLMLTQKVRYEQTLVNTQLNLYPMILISGVKHIKESTACQAVIEVRIFQFSDNEECVVFMMVP